MRAGMRGMGTLMASNVSGLGKFFPAFAGDASSSLRWLSEGLPAVRLCLQKGPRKQCICRAGDASQSLGLLTREREDIEREKSTRKKCINRDASLFFKSRGKLRRRGSGFRADFGRLIDAEKRSFVVGVVLFSDGY